VVERNVMVGMRDGVRFATDIYYPARDGVRLEGKFPAILERTPYNKGGRFHGPLGYPWQPYCASQGFVCISQDTRGRFKSEGVWHMMIDDLPDGFDTTRWLVKRPWSDGGFGMIGTSYVAGTQHAMALANPPGLKTLVPDDAVSDAATWACAMEGPGSCGSPTGSFLWPRPRAAAPRAIPPLARPSKNVRLTSEITFEICRFEKATPRFA
jgi:putative CocE/NonD family hydrolase